MVYSHLKRPVQRALVIVACVWALGAAAWAQDKKPVPDAASQGQAQKLVRDVYGKEYDAAKTSKEKTELAKNLLDQATKSKGDSTGHFVLLRVAKDVSILAGDADTALEAVERIVAIYDVDTMQIRLDCVTRLAAATKLASQYGALAERACSLIDVALAEDNFEAARQFGEIARESARRARNYALVKKVVAQMKKNEERQQAHAEYRKAAVRLEENPTDPQANLVAGRYLCLSRGDWERGIPLLALGSDASLKAAGEQELADPVDPIAQITLGDTWWDLAESADDATKVAFKRRAGCWYERAKPNITSALLQSKLALRLDEIGKDEASRAAAESPTRPPRTETTETSSKKTHPALGYELRPHAADALRAGEHWYKLFDGNMSWTEAQERCRAMGGYLVCMETQAEAAFIDARIKGKPGDYWLGGRRQPDGRWQWLTGSPFEVAHWAPGEPGNKRGNELYLASNPAGLWADYPLRSQHIDGFICEWEF